MAFSITASLAYKIERDISLKVNERTNIGRFQLELASVTEQQHENYSAVQAKLKVYDLEGRELFGELLPEKRFYTRNEEVTSEVDIRMTLRDDLYVALSGIEAPDPNSPGGQAAPQTVFLKVFVNPLQIWLWIGGVLMLVGTGFVLAPALPQMVVEEVPSEAQVRV